MGRQSRSVTVVNPVYVSMSLSPRFSYKNTLPHLLWTTYLDFHSFSPSMLPTSNFSRSAGLPTNPRPQMTMRNSPYHTPSDLTPVSSTPNNPGYAPLRTHTRSQPTRMYVLFFYNSTILRIWKVTIDEPSGNEYPIWNAVSNVASVLTVSVSKAWSTNISALSGEGGYNRDVGKWRYTWSWITETPPGQESRLTRTMKAYHIAHAQSPSDLPDWLFDERERRVPSRSSKSDDSSAQSQQNNIRQSAASSEQLTSASGEQQTSGSVSTKSVSTRSQLRGTDRLKAMRETKQRIQERDASKFPANHNQQVNISSYLPRQVIQPRVGLPSRPQWWCVISVRRDFDLWLADVGVIPW